MMTRIAKLIPAQRQGVRCLTRALKNARFLQKTAPQLFAKDSIAEGFGTGIPIDILRRLHRIPHDSPELQSHKALATFLKENKLPVPGKNARDPLFSGTIHFAQITFSTSGGNLMIPTADMNTIMQYAQHAIVPISEYASQYGSNSVSVAPALISHTVNVPTGSYTDVDVQTWVNDIVNQNSLPSNSCIVIVSPQGLSAPNVGGNAGYHGLARVPNVPYVVLGVFAQNLTLQDNPDVYAMVVSHEIAEMIVDPNVDGNNPEVCDPCDLNCANLTRIYFDASNTFLGANQNTPPSGFNFTYYVCAVVKPDGASQCPAPSADCQYAPSIGSPLAGILAHIIELVGTIIGFQTIDGSGIIIVGGIPHPVGPWGPMSPELAVKADILTGIAVEAMATHIGNAAGQVEVRRAALEMVRARVEVLLATLSEQTK
jgi:hypothetical protein